VAWLAIEFPGGVFGAEDSKPDFYAIVSNLRFVNYETVPDEQLMDVPSGFEPPARLLLKIKEL
jgi:hypothetical protein